MNEQIVVTGATGLQGGAVVTALLAAGKPVRALVRDTASPAAVSLSARGAALVKGDFEDAASLVAAFSGAAGVFSVQLPPDPNDPDSEIRTGQALVNAALAAGVQTVVHTSVARAGDQKNFAGWNEGRWWSNYWNSKSAVNEAVQAAGFAHTTLLKPAFMMDNFALPKSTPLMFPGLREGIIQTALAENTHLDLIAAEDVGRFAAAAFIDPVRFNGKAIELAAESLTMTEVAAILEQVKGVSVKAVSLSVTDALAAGIHPGVVNSCDWDNVEGYKVDIQALSEYGIPLTRFLDWAKQHRDQILVG